jgi:hypothetical protein
MYNYILDELIRLNQVGDIKLYLQGLQPYVKRLRQSYCSDFVSVDYSNPNVQAAYLLAYYPQYAEMTYQVFCDLDKNYLHRCFSECKEFQACFFGAGPAPETVGLVKYVNCNYSNLKYFVAHTYDIAADTWLRSREITKNVASQSFPSLYFTLDGNNLNLCQKNVLLPIRQVIDKCRLFVVQNCLNEFIYTPETFIENIKFIVAQMTNESILVIADLCKYSSVINLMQQIEMYIGNNNNLKLIRSCNEGNLYFRYSFELPTILTDTLLTSSNGLIPRRNINFNYLAVQKYPIAIEESSYAIIPF